MSDIDDGPVGRAGWVWIVALCGYSLARAVVAWPFLGRYGVSPAVFLLLDVATAYPLGLSQVRIVQGFAARDFGAVQVWATVAGISFVTPYAYLLVAGHQAFPPYVSAGLVALVALIGAVSVLRVRQECLDVDLDLDLDLEPALAGPAR